MANHGAVIRRWANRVGIEKIESFIDDFLSLENLIDPHRPQLLVCGPDLLPSAMHARAVNPGEASPSDVHADPGAGGTAKRGVVRLARHPRSQPMASQSDTEAVNLQVRHRRVVAARTPCE
jgi:hypothetical protein